MGVTMWVQMQLNPQQPDPVQQKIFNWMPVIFTFMLASFPSGLVIYWAWNNVLSLLQQYTIMRKNNTEVHLWKNLGVDKWKGRWRPCGTSTPAAEEQGRRASTPGSRSARPEAPRQAAVDRPSRGEAVRRQQRRRPSRERAAHEPAQPLPP
jgi:membrane protein insertase Oxa1/YidC/SpoIIIJ